MSDKPTTSRRRKSAAAPPQPVQLDIEGAIGTPAAPAARSKGADARTRRERGNKVSTAFVIDQRTQFILSKVAQLRAFRGLAVPEGERAHSMSTVVRALIDQHMPDLEGELTAAGLDVAAEFERHQQAQREADAQQE